MPNPKRKHSKTRRDTRRAHHHATVPVVAICSNCGSPHQYHRVCPECGSYRGRKVYEKEVTA